MSKHANPFSTPELSFAHDKRDTLLPSYANEKCSGVDNARKSGQCKKLKKRSTKEHLKKE